MKPFLLGKKNLTVAPLVAPHGLVPPRAVIHRGPGSQDPAHVESKHSVEVVKEGDKVVRIVVVCACGERVDIECLYPAGA